MIGIDAQHRIGYGWSFPEDWGVWADGNQANLLVPLPLKPSKNLILNVNAFVGKSHPAQNISVFVNGIEQNHVTLISPTNNQIILDVPQNMSQTFLDIQLFFRNPVRPDEVEFQGDPRQLSIGLISATFH